MPTPNKRRPHLVPPRWRAVPVRARYRKVPGQPGEIQQTIAELEEFIVTADEKRLRQRALHVLPAERPAALPRQVPLRYDQKAAVSKERLRLLVAIGIGAVALVLVSAWLFCRLRLGL